MVGSAGLEGVEVGDPVDAEHDGFAVQDKPRPADLPRRFDDPGKPLGPVQAALGKQPHAVPVALHAEPVVVVFDLVDPVTAGRYRLLGGRYAEQILWHSRHLCTALRNASPQTRSGSASWTPIFRRSTETW